MANSTRIKVAQAATPYVRVDAGSSGGTMPSNADWASHDVPHNDPLTTGLGSSVDIELHNDAATTWSSAPSITLSNANITAFSNSQDGLILVHIKHSGYKESTKETATTAKLKVFMDSSDAQKFFTLYPNESITLHGPFGTASDNITDWAVQSEDDKGLYVEVVTGIAGPAES